MDYGRDVEFGYFPVPNADDYPSFLLPAGPLKTFKRLPEDVAENTEPSAC
jgi:hypothetical protein